MQLWSIESLRSAGRACLLHMHVMTIPYPPLLVICVLDPGNQSRMGQLAGTGILADP